MNQTRGLRCVLALSAAVLLQTASDITAQSRSCLHGTAETAAEKQRRDGAIRYARALIDAEMVAKKSGAFLPLDKLPKLPEAPSGFKMQLTTDGATFAFSAKDTLDVCGFAIFSDQHGFIYEASPVNRPGVRTAS